MADVKKEIGNLVAIKAEYIKKEPEEGETPDKKPRLDDGKEEPGGKVDGESDSFRHRRDYKANAKRGYTPMHQNLCRVLIDVPEDAPMPVCSTPRCQYIHDISKYLETKLLINSSKCYLYSLKGHCPWGATCLFANHHLTDCGRNRVDEKVKSNFEANGTKTFNFFNADIEKELKKRSYDFKRSQEILELLAKPPAPVWNRLKEVDFTEDVDICDSIDEPPPLERAKEERIGPCPEDDLFKLHLSEKKKIDWRDKLFLPSLANFGNLPFRRICKEYGADITCSEPLVAASLLEASKFDWLLSRRHETEDIFGLQVVGTNPFALTRCCQLMEEKTNADYISLSFGNPGENKFGRPGNRSAAMDVVVRCMSKATHLPLAVSSKLGDVRDLASCFKACQISSLTLRGRKMVEPLEVDWEGHNDMAEQVSPVPVMVYSDVFSYLEYTETRAKNPAFGNLIMARAALVKPWIFEELKMNRNRDISSSERFELIRRFVNYGLENWGSDSKGVEVTRRFLIDWLSFLCRYIPLGLLEIPPQKLNDKCAKFVGRDDMETLLSSHEQSDWVKISEMLLGPVPEGFNFTRKVKYWPLDS